MKFVDKILALRDFQSQTDRNDLTLMDYMDDVIDVSERSFSLEEMRYANGLAIKNGKDNMNNIDLLEKVTDAATFLYTKNFGDSVAPNILISKLPNKQYYVSLNRYMTPTDRYTKTIVFKATNKNLQEALMDVAKFLSKQKATKVNPLEELEKLFDKDPGSYFYNDSADY